MRSNNAPRSYQARVGARFKNNERPAKRARTGMLEPKFDQDDAGEGTGSIFWTLVPLQLPNSAPAPTSRACPRRPRKSRDNWKRRPSSSRGVGAKR